MKVTKQDKQSAALVANMVAAVTGATQAEASVAPQAEAGAESTPAKKPVAKKVVKVVSKTQAKKAAKPTKAVKKAAKAGAKAAVAKAQESSKNPDVVKSAKQGLTYGQWLKLLQNTAATREVKIPATEAALNKRFQPLYMKGMKIADALAA